MMTNTASRGRGRGGRTSGGPGGHGGRGYGRQDGSSSRGPGGHSSGSKPMCQLCKRSGHMVLRCYKRFDVNFTGEEEKLAAAASYGIDTNWYVDSAATDHITGELDKLTTRKRYTSHDHIHVANGSGMDISHSGHYTFRTSFRDLHPHSILHVHTHESLL